MTTGRTPTDRHQRSALLPGFINAHSHAFQRGLRARASVSRRVGPLLDLARGDVRAGRAARRARAVPAPVQAFEEMRDAGTTTVGEFHYLHHAGDGTDYEFDRVVLDAAAAAGIRIVLLQTYYATGGFGQPLGPAQRRFRSTDLGCVLEADRHSRIGPRSPDPEPRRSGAQHPRRRGQGHRDATSPRHSAGGCRSTCMWRSSSGRSRTVSRRTAGRPMRVLLEPSRSGEPDRGTLHPYRTRGSAAVSPGRRNCVCQSAYRG